MGIFAYEKVLQDIPFAKCWRPKKKILNFSGHLTAEFSK
jgi:hypothetical protein